MNFTFELAPNVKGHGFRIVSTFVADGWSLQDLQLKLTQNNVINGQFQFFAEKGEYRNLNGAYYHLLPDVFGPERYSHTFAILGIPGDINEVFLKDGAKYHLEGVVAVFYLYPEEIPEPEDVWFLVTQITEIKCASPLQTT